MPAQNSGPNPLTWNVGTLQVGEAFEALVTVKATGSGVLENKIRHRPRIGTPPYHHGHRKDCLRQRALAEPDQERVPHVRCAGGNVQYTIQVNNVGSGPTSSPMIITE